MKRKNRRKIVLGILIVGLAVLAGCSVPDQGNSDNRETPQGNVFEMKSTGGTDMGDVSVELQPHAVREGKLSVDLSVNTHSVDLSQFDLNEITTLEYDGKTTKPMSAPRLGGHHASGTLVFEVDENIQKFVIKINGIPQVQERVFEWTHE